MNEDTLYKMRHTLSHILAQEVLEMFPNAKLGIGPVIEDGFYYDFDLGGKTFSMSDLEKLEKQMKNSISKGIKMEKKDRGVDESINYLKKKNQPYKAEIAEDLKKEGETKVSFYTLVDKNEKKRFRDLCRGGHVESAKDIGAFTLNKTAGAYWRGDETRPMLQRIYGLAFATKKELKEYLARLDEAKKRDHKKLGIELDLFTFSDLVGAGLALWTPRGTFLRTILNDFVWQLRKAQGYELVEIPHIAKKDLYEKSGHWEKFQNELFMIETREKHFFAVKPMNCPHHTQIYARKQHSYRELPARYANTTMVYRDEQSGELQGLVRVRAITQDDAHVFCRFSQVAGEIIKIWDIVQEFYSAVGFQLRARLSFHDPKQMEKYLGEEEKWKEAEETLREIVRKKKTDAPAAVGEAAFYGPKIDFIAKDSLGREWQMATIQLDMNMPERFDLVCINENGKKERIIMIHAAVMGSIERFLSIIIEHFAGAFPVWLSPTQVQIIPVSKDFIHEANDLGKKIKTQGIRVEVDEENETVAYKIRKAEKLKAPYMLVFGEKEAKGKKISVRRRGEKEVEAFLLDEFLKHIKSIIDTKSLGL